MKIAAAGGTDVGRTRDHNEDAIAIMASEHLFVVADGMGGHESGEVASKMAVDTMTDYYLNTTGGEGALSTATDASVVQAANRLLYGIRLANKNIHDVARRERKTMGTTIVAAHLVGDTMHVAHVGDSRAYLIRSGGSVQLTRDHSALEAFKMLPGVTEEDVRHFPYRNVIMRALGTLPEVSVDLRSLRAAEGDVFLLCCDGLTNMVDDATMLAIVQGAASLESAVGALIDAANQAGGDDNISVVLVRCGGR